MLKTRSRAVLYGLKNIFEIMSLGGGGLNLPLPSSLLLQQSLYLWEIKFSILKKLILIDLQS